MVVFWGWRVDGSRDEPSTLQGEGPMGMRADEPQIPRAFSTDDWGEGGWDKKIWNVGTVSWEWMRRCEGMVDVVDEGTALSGNVAARGCRD